MERQIVKLRWNGLHRVYQGTDGNMYRTGEAVVMVRNGFAAFVRGHEPDQVVKY